MFSGHTGSRHCVLDDHNELAPGSCGWMSMGTMTLPRKVVGSAKSSSLHESNRTDSILHKYTRRVTESGSGEMNQPVHATLLPPTTDRRQRAGIASVLVILTRALEQNRSTIVLSAKQVLYCALLNSVWFVRPQSHTSACTLPMMHAKMIQFIDKRKKKKDNWLFFKWKSSKVTKKSFLLCLFDDGLASLFVFVLNGIVIRVLVQ